MINRAASVAALAALACATGCANFFPPLNSSGGSSGTTNTGDYVYVGSSYTVSGTPTYNLSSYSLASGQLTQLSGSPATLLVPPATSAVNHDNNLLYVAGNGVIYGYTIATNGTLTAIENASSSPALANANIVSMVISPDGQWLLALDANASLVTVDEFQIQSTGLLTLESGSQYQLKSANTIVASQIAVSPQGDYVAAALGTGGDVLFSFNTSTGALAPVTEVDPPSTSSADQAVVFDSAGATLYVARSGSNSGVLPYIIGSGGSLAVVSGAPFSLGSTSNAAGPASIVIDTTGKYLYVGNKTSSSISGFVIGTGAVLTAISGSPFTSGTTVNALAVDNSGKYLIASALSGSPDIEIFSFDGTTAGKLDLASSLSSTALTGSATIALTH